ncbi:MAG TPA: SCO family protein [Sphingobacteriaceae bacterium]|nr:SCO family protein [Sphingobacteriaceae bacterium]
MEEKPRNSKGFVKVLVLAAILILPGFLYYLLEREGKNSYKPLPIYGEKTLTGTFSSRMGEQIPDTAYHKVPEGSFVNSQGQRITVPAQDTSISIVNFFFTRCDSFCEHMNDEMNRVAVRFSTNPKVRLFTFSVDTAYDRPEILADYVTNAGYDLESSKWSFLSGHSSAYAAGGESIDLLNYARNAWLVDAVQDTTREAAFIHSSALILMDSQRRIRGYYDVNHPKEVDRLIDEVKLLLVEEVRQRAH